MMKPTDRQLHLWVSRELHKAVKSRCAQEERSVISVIRLLLEGWVNGTVKLPEKDKMK